MRQRERGPICCGRLRVGQEEKKTLTGVRSPLETEENAGKAVFGQTGALTGSLIKTASQAVSTLPVGGRHLGEIVLLKGRQLGEERIGGNGLNRGRMCPRFRSGVGQPESEMLQNPSDDLGVIR